MANTPHTPESQAYADAIMAAVGHVSKNVRQPNMGALLGALVGVQAHFIAGVSDRKIRRGLERDLNKMLSSLIAEQIQDGSSAHVQTIIKRAH